MVNLHLEGRGRLETLNLRRTRMEGSMASTSRRQQVLKLLALMAASVSAALISSQRGPQCRKAVSNSTSGDAARSGSRTLFNEEWSHYTGESLLAARKSFLDSLSCFLHGPNGSRQSALVLLPKARGSLLMLNNAARYREAVFASEQKTSAHEVNLDRRRLSLPSASESPLAA